MRNIHSCLFIFFMFFCAISCSKDKSNKIDINDIHVLDAFGNPVSGPNDNQWKRIPFTQREKALFEMLDTVSLIGTTALETVERIYGYPNPTNAHLFLGFHVPSGVTANTVIKWVMVNERMQPFGSGWALLNSDNWTSIRLNVFQLPTRKHRMYITLSAENKPHYFTTWGNVQVGF
jgi:hypothetical protein